MSPQLESESIVHDDRLQEQAEKAFKRAAREGDLSFRDFQDAEVTRLRTNCAEEGETGPEFSDVAHLVAIEYLVFDDLTDYTKEAFRREALEELNDIRDTEETYRELDRWVTHG